MVINDINLLTALLLVGGLFAPALYLFANGQRINAMDPIRRTLVRQWLYFLAVILGIRFLGGVLFAVTDIWPYGVGKFYPIRIAYPNYGLLVGLPYLLFCIAIVMNLERIRNYIAGSRWKYFLLWFFSVVLLLSFGGIHGGLITGNIGISNSAEHLADAQLNGTISEVLSTHTDRIVGGVTPPYQAPHSISHPAGSLVYWQVIANNLPPVLFSVVNVLLFSIAFPLLFWALRRRFDDATALQGTLACLTIPALLIYGRADDAVYYFIAGVVAALMAVAIVEKKYFLTLAGSVTFCVAMNFSYASVVLLPAVFAFSAELPLSQVGKYFRRVFPHILIVLPVVLVSMAGIALWVNYDWVDAFLAAVRHNQGSTMREIFIRGEYGRAINDRIMAITDFLIFGGPLMLLLLRRRLMDPVRKIGDFKIKDLALAVLFAMLILNSNGPGGCRVLGAACSC